MVNAATDIILEINKQALVVNYECATDHVLYSIADYSGNVVARGNCNDVENNSLDISMLPKGTYMLCIIDGDSLVKTRFEKLQ
jgi:hypothetical protein